MHSRAQLSGVPLGNAGDQVGVPSQSQRCREAADNRDNLPLQPEGLQGFVDPSLLEIPPRDENVLAGRITDGRDLASTQRVSCSHDADEPVSEQSLRAHLRTCPLSYDTGFQIDDPVAKRRAVFVCLLHEAQPHAGRSFAGASDQVRSEVLHEAFAGPQRERADELSEIEDLDRAQSRFSIPHELTDALT